MVGRILFVPGFHSKRFNPLEKGKEIKEYLEAEGYKVYASNYSDGKATRKPLTVYVEVVRMELKMIKPTAVIAHSMAGLIVMRAILQNDCQLDKLILLESPLGGAPFWAMKIWMVKTGASLNWPSIQDMLKNSAFLQQLHRNWQENKNQITTSYFQIGGIYSVLFPGIFIFPQVPTKIFKTVSHSGLRSNPRVIETIIKILKS